MAALTTSSNAIEGTQNLAVRIHDLKAADEVAKQILDLHEQAAKITCINVDLTTYFQALDEQEELADATQAHLKIADNVEGKTTPTESPPENNTSLDADRTAAQLCAPLIAILTTITSHGGNLKQFTWPAADHTDRNFTRPAEFWTALYAHALGLVELHLDFFCHEVGALLPPPPSTTFPALRTLKLDTNSAHGDDGTAVDSLLRACPNLDALNFEWPLCDLETCQIRNVSWDWSFVQLNKLSVFGWNFAPEKYTQFLARHPGIEVLDERVDGPYGENDEDTGYKEVSLPIDALPNLKELTKSYTWTHPLAAYFNDAARRPLSNLTLHVHSYRGVEQDLPHITQTSTGQTRLKNLRLVTDIKSWRKTQEQSSDDDTDDEDNVPTTTATPPALLPIPQLLQTTLATLATTSLLTRLTLDLDSSNPSTYIRETGTWVYDPAMNETDLLH
ncbi:hypothetical protein N0V94_008178, partial [Neodidymelliopsis sp. IMI 364377]